jgi:hypothetical protein
VGSEKSRFVVYFFVFLAFPSKTLKMKRSIFMLLAVSALSFSSNAQAPKHQIDYVARTTATPKGCIEVPSQFAKGNLFDQSVLHALNEKKVVKVELWYTRFKENPSFDQVKLNNSRIQQLQAAYPELKNTDIEWVWKEQTEADTKNEAQKCFHGFRIFTADEQPLWTNEFRIADASNKAETISVDVTKGATFTAKSGSVVHIPPGAVADLNGNPVVGNYTVEYTEYRNPAQIAYSGLPMNFSEAGQDYAFNSAGMYEIHGTQNGQPLQLVQPVTVDFNCTSQIKDLNFYALDQQTGTWLKRQPLNFTEEKAAVAEPKEIAKVELEDFAVAVFQENLSMTYTLDQKKVCTSTLNDENWKRYQELKNKEPDYVKKVILGEIADKRQIQFKEKDANQLTGKIFGDAWKVNSDFAITANRTPVKGVQQSATLLAAGADKGHTYPNMIKGLNSPKFGVYNCDQQYRMGQTVTLVPTYYDKQTGNPIARMSVMCVIDRNINGSFSFDPARITMSKDQLTDLVLFTQDNKVYYLSSKDLSGLEQGMKIELKMTDITAQVKSSADLQKFLNL